MTARIYTAAEAAALRSAATPGPWRTYGNAAHDDAPSDAWTIAHDGDTLAELHADDRPQYGDASDEEVAEIVEADADLMAAAPDLAASVAFHARRAEKTEAELIDAHDRARDAETERAAAEAALTAVWQAITDDDLPRLPGGDGTVVDAEAVGQRVAAAFSSTVRGVLDAVGARDRKVPPLPFASLVAWLATETRLVVDDLAMARDNHHARATMAEAEVARLTVALTAQTARADGAEAEALRVTRERDAAIKRATNAERMRDAFVATSVAFASDEVDRDDAMARRIAERDAALSQAEELTRALAEARVDRDALSALRDDAAAARDAAERERDALRAELDAAWRAFPSAGAVRGMVSLADVVADLVEVRAELTQEREALRAAARRVAEAQRGADLALTDLFALVPAEEARRD